MQEFVRAIHRTIRNDNIPRLVRNTDRIISVICKYTEHIISVSGKLRLYAVSLFFICQASSEKIFTRSVYTAFFNKHICSAETHSAASRIENTVCHKNICVCKSGNAVITRVKLASVYFNILAPCNMYPIVSCVDRNILCHNIFAVKKSICPISAIFNRITRKAYIFAVEHIYTMRSAIVFFPQFIKAITAVKKRVFLAYNCNIFCIYSFYKSIVPTAARS